MDPKKQKFNAVGFNLHKITTEQFALMPEHYDTQVQEVGLGVGLKFGMSVKERLVAVFIKVQFETGGNTFLLAEIGHHYVIESSAWESFKQETDKYILPKGFATHLVVLAVGTLRGFLHAKTENTTMNQFILPTINVTEMVTEDVELSE